MRRRDNPIRELIRDAVRQSTGRNSRGRTSPATTPGVVVPEGDGGEVGNVMVWDLHRWDSRVWGEG